MSVVRFAVLTTPYGDRTLRVAIICAADPSCRKAAQGCFDTIGKMFAKNEGANWEDEYDDFLKGADAGYTDHGNERANDPNRDVGNPQDVIDNGEPFRDTETDANVYVDGNKVVITGDNGIVTQWNDQTAAQTSRNVETGKWSPL